MVEQHRGTGVGNLRAEVPHIGHRVCEFEANASGARDPIGLARAARGDRPSVGGCHDFPDRQAGERGRPAEAHVADELLPDELVDVVEALDGESGVAPERGDALQTGRDRAPGLAQTHQLHAVVMGAARRRDRGAKAGDDADDHALPAQGSGDLGGAAEPVLDGQHRGFGAEQGACGRRRRLHLRRLRGEDDEVAGADVGGIGRRPDRDHAAPARAFESEPVRRDRIDMGLPGIDRPDFVAGVRHERGIDAAHGACADDPDLHASLPRLPRCAPIRLRRMGRCGRRAVRTMPPPARRRLR